MSTKNVVVGDRKPLLRRIPSAFTLAELIVVITILVILWTIAFISLGWYSLSARDSTRISDITNLRKTLELSAIKTGFYPTPTNGSGITFSWGLVWNEWSIGDSVINYLNSAGFKLSKKSTDPKYQNTEYAYSLLNNGKEYQVGAIVEDNATAYDSIITPVNASNDVLSAYIGGNYNGLIAKAQTGTTTYYLNIPSIILQDISTTSAKELTNQATQSGNLVLHKKSNLPHTYPITGMSLSPSVTFTAMSNSNQLTNGSGIVAYSMTGSSLDSTGVTTMMTNLYNIYNTSNLKWDTTSANQINAFIAGWTWASALVSVFNSAISKSVGWSVVSNDWGAWGGYSPGQPYSPLLTYTATQTFTYNGALVTVSAIGTGVSDSKYTNCPSFDVAVWKTGDVVPQIWSLCNVGATAVFAGTQSGAADSPISTLTTAGKFFQYWENTAWTYGVSTVWTADNCVWNRDTQTCGVTAWLSSWPTAVSDIYDDSLPGRWYDWWGNAAGADTRGPCAIGYHVPTFNEWDTVYTTTFWSRNNFVTTLKIPMSGYRSSSGGAFTNVGNAGYYWSSRPLSLGGGTPTLMVHTTGAITGQNFQRVMGNSVRCLRN